MTGARSGTERPFPLGLLLAAILIQAASAPGQTVGLSVLVRPIVDELGVSRSAVSAAYLVGTLCGALALRPVGRLLDRLGVRRVAIGVGALFGLVTAAMAGATGMLALTIGFVGTRALGQGALTLTASTAIVVGFDRRRGLAIGLTSALGGALMSLVPLAIVVLVDRVGLQTTWIVLGATSGALVVGLAISPLLDQREAAGPDTVGSGSDVAPPSWTAPEAMRTPAFLATASAVTLSALVATALTFHQIDLLAARGLSETQAAANFLPQTLAGAAAAIVAGRLTDRLAPQVLLTSCMATLGAACLMVQVVGAGPGVVVYGAALGAAGSALRTVETASLARWFGVLHIGEIRGAVMAATVAGSAAGPLLLALSVDHLGGYTRMLWVFAAACGAAAVVTALVPDPSPRPNSTLTSP